MDSFSSYCFRARLGKAALALGLILLLAACGKMPKDVAPPPDAAPYEPVYPSADP